MVTMALVTAVPAVNDLCSIFTYTVSNDILYTATFVPGVPLGAVVAVHVMAGTQFNHRLSNEGLLCTTLVTGSDQLYAEEAERIALKRPIFSYTSHPDAWVTVDMAAYFSLVDVVEKS